MSESMNAAAETDISASLHTAMAAALHSQLPGCTHDEHGADCEALVDAALAVRDRRMEQLEAGRETWKAKAAEIEADRDRLATEAAQHITANLEAAERAQRVIEALRLNVADLERIAAGPQPPEQDSTGWQ